MDKDDVSDLTDDSKQMMLHQQAIDAILLLSNRIKEIRLAIVKFMKMAGDRKRSKYSYAISSGKTHVYTDTMINIPSCCYHLFFLLSTLFTCSTSLTKSSSTAELFLAGVLVMCLNGLPWLSVGNDMLMEISVSSKYKDDPSMQDKSIMVVQN